MADEYFSGLDYLQPVQDWYLDTGSYAPISESTGMDGFYNPNASWESMTSPMYESSYGSQSGLLPSSGSLYDISDYTQTPDASLLSSLPSMSQVGGFLKDYGPLLAGGLGLYGNYMAQQQQQEQMKKQLQLIREQQELAEKKDAVANYMEPWKVDLATKFMERSNLDPAMLAQARAAAQKGYSQAYGGSPYVGSAFQNNPFGPPVQMAEGGLGMLSGATGGQADEIPASLSDGEYVVPADVVSDLGDGNSNAGGLALTKMIKNVRKHKGRKDKLPPAAKSPEKYLKKG